MPNVYQDPQYFGLELIQHLTQIRFYEGDEVFIWHIAVWRNIKTQQLLYGVDMNDGHRVDNTPFIEFVSLAELKMISGDVGYAIFKEALNAMWRGGIAGRLSPRSKSERNTRKRFQRTVRRMLFGPSEPELNERPAQQSQGQR